MIRLQQRNKKSKDEEVLDKPIRLTDLEFVNITVISRDFTVTVINVT